jgi:cupin superfamily acireductone dioxygenase involved in methionine salvage
VNLAVIDKIEEILETGVKAVTLKRIDAQRIVKHLTAKKSENDLKKEIGRLRRQLNYSRNRVLVVKNAASAIAAWIQRELNP